MDTNDFKKLLRTTVIVPVVLLAILASILLAQAGFLIASMARLEHTGNVISDLRVVMHLIIDMETGMRGYLLTGQEFYLETHTQSEPKVEALLNNLEALLQDSPGDQSSMRAYRNEYKTWLDYSKQMIALRRTQGNFDNPELNLRGKLLMDSVRETCERLVADQETMRGQRASTARKAAHWVLLSVGLLTLLIGIVIAVSTYRRMVKLNSIYDRHLGLERRRTAEAHETRQWLLATLTGMGEAVVATDTAGRVQFMNPVAESLTGWTQERAEGRQLRDIYNVSDQRIVELEKDSDNSVRKNRNSGALPEHSLLRSRTGEEYFVDQTAAEITDEQGVTRGSVLVFRDMTQRKRSDDALRSSEKLVLIGRMSATIAHEIRNPLDSVSNLLYLLRRNPRMNEEGKEFINLAEEELARVAQIVNQLLSFNREARNPVQVDIVEVIESTLTLFAPKLQQQQIKVIRDFGNRRTVCGFPGELRQVFSNLIVNSMEASRRGGLITVRIKPSKDWALEDRDGVRVLICDDGVGIPEKARTNLFRPFFTTKGERGTGLGLWVSRGIVQKHEGSMKFRTSTNHGSSGTCFNIFLPLEQILPPNVTDLASKSGS